MRMPPKKISEDQRDQENDSDQRKHSDDQIADVVALAHRGCFVPRDLGFVIYGVEKRMRLAASDGAGYNIDQRVRCASRAESSEIDCSTLCKARRRSPAICGVGY